MAIYDILPTSFKDRIRIWLNRSPTTPIANWDTLSPISLPQPDVDTVQAMIVERVAAHAQAGSLDDAHGDLLDRIIHPRCRTWSEQTRIAYEEQLRVWDYLEEQGTEHSIDLGHKLARLNIDLARHQGIEDRLWAELGTDRKPTATAAELAGGEPLPLPAVPTAQLPHPYHAPEPEPTVPRIHSI
ncbi:hypothetical protein ACWDTG_25920 [Rhodococcus zopfii]